MLPTFVHIDTCTPVTRLLNSKSSFWKAFKYPQHLNIIHSSVSFVTNTKFRFLLLLQFQAVTLPQKWAKKTTWNYRFHRKQSIYVICLGSDGREHSNQKWVPTVSLKILFCNSRKFGGSSFPSFECYCIKRCRNGKDYDNGIFIACIAFLHRRW